MENNYYLASSQVSNLPINSEINNDKRCEDVDMKIIDNQFNQIDDSLSTKSDLNELNRQQQQTKEDLIEEEISCTQLADWLLKNSSNACFCILIDSRSFIDYNNCHIQEAINVCCSNKIIKRRLQNGKVSCFLFYLDLFEIV